MEHVPPSDATEGFQEDLARDRWRTEQAQSGLGARMMAEAVGTFAFVLIGLGTAMFSSFSNNGSLAVGLAFGVALMVVVVAVGRISGAHINPAVTVGAWLAGRFPAKDIAPYILAQVVGALIAGSTLAAIAASNSLIDDSRLFMSTVANGFGDHSPASFSVGVGLTTELIATGLLMAVVLVATSVRAKRSQAPLTIGLAYAILMVWTIPFTNGALNPARATAVAPFAEGWALPQLWVFWLAPVLGAAVVGLLYRAFGPEEDFESTELAVEPVADQ